jgi:hypothetical protein
MFSGAGLIIYYTDNGNDPSISPSKQSAWVIPKNVPKKSERNKGPLEHPH